MVRQLHLVSMRILIIAGQHMLTAVQPIASLRAKAADSLMLPKAGGCGWVACIGGSDQVSTRAYLKRHLDSRRAEGAARCPGMRNCRKAGEEA